VGFLWARRSIGQNDHEADVGFFLGVGGNWSNEVLLIDT